MNWIGTVAISAYHVAHSHHGKLILVSRKFEDGEKTERPSSTQPTQDERHKLLSERDVCLGFRFCPIFRAFSQEVQQLG